MSIDWVKAVSEIGETDLADITSRIKSLTGELESLRSVERFMKTKLGLNRPHRATAPAQPKLPVVTAPKGAFAVYREKAVVFLVHSGKPEKPSAVAGSCGIPTGSTQAVFDHPWFERRPEGVVLTPEGRKAAG